MVAPITVVLFIINVTHDNVEHFAIKSTKQDIGQLLQYPYRKPNGKCEPDGVDSPQACIIFVKKMPEQFTAMDFTFNN